MLNNYNIKVDNGTTINNTIVPEDINVNIYKTNDSSFFLEVNKNTKQYDNFIQENPVLLKETFVRFTEEDYKSNDYSTRMKMKVAGGYKTVTDKIPVKILSINYSGGGNFIFELIKL